MQEGIQGAQEKYVCHICMERAQKPVVTPCGHLFCWACIYLWLRSNQQYLTCPICKSGLQIPMLRPIYYPNQPAQKNQSGIPPRPRAHRKTKPKNPLALKQLPKSISKVGMNLYRGVLLAGYGIFPSCYSMIFQNHVRPLPNQGPFGSNLQYKLSNYLEAIFFLVAVLMIGVIVFV